MRRDLGGTPRRLAKRAPTARTVALLLSMLAGSSSAFRCRVGDAPVTTPATLDGSRPRPSCCPNGQRSTTPASATHPSGTDPTPNVGRALARDAVRPLELAWRFHAGAPIDVVPAVGADGTVVVATSDGYVDFLNSDGTLRWSYTVEGAIAGTPVIGRRSLLVGTSAGHLVSLSFDGTARWQIRIPEAITTGVQSEPLGLMFFGAGSRRVYGAFPEGAAISFDVEAPVSSGPIRLGNGLFAVGTSAGRLLLFDRTGIKHNCEIASSALLDLFETESSVLHVLTSDTLLALDQGGQTLWRRHGVHAAAAADSALVVLESDGNELQWLDSTGQTLRRVRLDGQASRPPVLGPDGLLYVPRVDGRLDGLSTDGTVQTTVAVCGAPLLRPVLDSPRSRLIVASADGTVVAAGIRAQLP